jgi:D-amino peptidase
MRVYIQFDFEGVAGFVIRDNQDRNIPVNLERTRRFMEIATAEVSAAAMGAFEAGAEEVVIWDSHGYGNTLLVEELPEQAQLITGECNQGPWLPFFRGTDVGIFIGGHAKAGTAHAVTPHSMFEVNGEEYGEVGMFILECGSQDIPVVLISGGSAVQREVQYMIPDSEFVVTKDAAGPTIAKTITPALSAERIREASRRGIERRNQILPYHLEPPFTFRAGKVKERRVPPEGFTPDTEDFLAAYRMFLSTHMNYYKGWPDYGLKNENYGPYE